MRFRYTFAPTLAILLALLLTLAPPQEAGAAAEETLIPIHVAADTNLIHLARDYCRDRSAWKTIAEVNQLSEPYTIYRETTLQVPLSLLVTEKLSATVAAVQGPVSVASDDGRFTPLAAGDTLLPGQTVVTGEDGYAHLVFADHSHTRIESNSRLTLHSLFRLRDGSLKVDFHLSQGRVIHWVREKLQPNETFRTRTPIAVTGIRGTEFRLKMDDGATNTVEALSGQVDLAAGGRSVTLQGGQGSRVRANGRPAPPRPLPETPAAPILEPIYRTLPLLIDAPAHRTARQIRLRVTADSEGQATLLEQAAAPGGRFNLSGLADGVYFARFTAIDAEGYESRPAGPLPLKIRTVPAAPLVSAPKNGSTVWDRRVRVEWLASEHASLYRLQVAVDPDFRQLVDAQEAAEAGATTAELSPGTYHLRVQTLTADGFATLFSTPVTCTVADQPQMAGMEASSRDKATLQWAPMAEGWTYDLQVATDREFTRLVVDRKDLSATSLTLEDRLDPGAYHVRLRGVEKGEPATPWTPPQTMTVKRSLGWEDGLAAVILLGLLLL